MAEKQHRPSDTSTARPPSRVPVIAAVIVVVAAGLYIVVRRPAPTVSAYATFPSASVTPSSPSAGSEKDAATPPVEASAKSVPR